MSETRTYQTSPEQLEKIAGQMKQHGFDFDLKQPHGSATAQGFSFEWNLSQDSVAITLNSHPWAMGGLFWKQIDSYLHTS